MGSPEKRYPGGAPPAPETAIALRAPVRACATTPALPTCGMTCSRLSPDLRQECRGTGRPARRRGAPSPRPGAMPDGGLLPQQPCAGFKKRPRVCSGTAGRCADCQPRGLCRPAWWASLGACVRGRGPRASRGAGRQHATLVCRVRGRPHRTHLVHGLGPCTLQPRVPGCGAAPTPAPPALALMTPKMKEGMRAHGAGLSLATPCCLSRRVRYMGPPQNRDRGRGVLLLFATLVCSCSSYHRGQVRFGRWVAGAEVAEKIGTERTPRDSESAVPLEIFD